MVDISLAEMKETPMLEKAIKRMSEKGISIDEMEDMMLDSSNSWMKMVKYVKC